MLRNLWVPSLALTLFACRSEGLDLEDNLDGFKVSDGAGQHDASALQAFDASASSFADLAASSPPDLSTHANQDGAEENQDAGSMTLPPPAPWTASFSDWFLTFYDTLDNPTSKYAGSVDSTTLYAGAPTFEIVSNGASKSDCGILYEQIGSVGPWLGKRVRMTAAVKNTLATGSYAALEFYVEGQGTQITGDDMRNRHITGTKGFTSYSLVLDVESNADVIGYTITMCGTGTVWVSPPVFQQVDDSVPTTQTFSNP